MTPYEITHVFPDIAPHELLAAMTTPTHQQLQDKVADIERRDFLGRESDAQHYRCECMVYPRRKIPAYVRPLLGGGLECHEVVLWTKANDYLEIDVRPAVLGGRARVRATCKVTADGTSTVRQYSGQVTVEVRLIGPKVERAIVAEMLKTLDAAAAATRAWLASR
ncbi:MAG: DUF2505 family protein [Myxococcales bacterium]|nr:DUF2505 family protein [Myxococcales bacterium]